MPRDAGGTYTLAAGNPVSSGTLIESSWANTTLDDLAVAMTDSLSRSGSGGMLVAFKAINGAVATPAYTFTNDPTTGMWLDQAVNSIKMSVMGVNVLRLLSTGAMRTLGDIDIAKLASGDRVAQLRVFADDTNTNGSLLVSRAAGVNGAATVSNFGTGELVLDKSVDGGGIALKGKSGDDITLRVGAADTLTANEAGGTLAGAWDVSFVAGSIDTADIADNAITNAKMANNSVDSAEIVNDAVTTGKIAVNNITKELINADVAGTNINQNANGSLEVPQATFTVKGVVELATQGETDAGVNDQNPVTPAKLALTTLKFEPKAGFQAWAKWTTITTTTLQDSYGVSSVTDLGVGKSRVNWATNFSGADDYAVVVSCLDGSNAVYNAAPLANSCDVLTETYNNNPADNSDVSIIAQGNQ